MAKWDLSKLPEGRKPLPDEWFAERAQMQERLNMLEANLAKALKALDAIRLYSTDGDAHRKARATIAELTGGKDE